MVTLISSLPQNLLYEVFLRYLDIPRVPNASKPVVRYAANTLSTPIPLSHVCLTWREVVCSSPLLWSSIFVLGTSRKQFPLIELWLERSGSVPLTLHFLQKGYGEGGSELREATSSLLRLFLRHSARWKKINFQFADASTTKTRFPLSHTELSNLPLLEEARVVGNPGWGDDEKFKISSQIFRSKSLRSVECGIPGGPHANLTEIICNDPISYHTTFSILKGCPSLEVLDISLTPSNPTPLPKSPAQIVPLTHANLQQFRLRCSEPGLTLPALWGLTLPNLIEFDTYDSHKGYLQALHTMLARSNCHLRSLRMVPIPQTATSEATAKFFSIPQLGSLVRLAVVAANTSSLQWLTQISNLPLLKYLEVDGIEAEGSVLSDALVARLSSLQKVVIIGGPELDEMPLSDKLWSHPGIRLQAFDGRVYHDLLETHPRRQIRSPGGWSMH